MKVTNVQKCDFSQSWTLSLQNFSASMPPDPLRRHKIFFLAVAWLQKFFRIDFPPPKQKILDRTLTTTASARCLVTTFQLICYSQQANEYLGQGVLICRKIVCVCVCGGGGRGLWYLLGFEIPIFGTSWGLFFASSLKPIMVFFGFQIKEDLSNLISKCSNLFGFVMHIDI